MTANMPPSQSLDATDRDDTPPDGDVRPPLDESQPSAGMLALRTILGLLALFGVVAIGSIWLKEPLENIGVQFLEQYGLLGMFIGTALSDSLGVPIPVDTYLAACITANAPTVPVILTASAASLTGGNIAYVLGRYADRLPGFDRLIARFKKRGESAFERWGVAAVAVAAWTPVPFSIICWSAGAFKMDYKRFALTALHRIPRIVVYYYVITLGWAVG